ncbi:hypothetical protein [Streptomyces sp. NPDC001292]|uniref:hypothetical protein n=1 Tax=Streptomyces sp. NPDC001292 TaxID=3364558 RepID=UPI0036D0F762
MTTKPAENPTPRGGTVYASYDHPNTGRIQVMSMSLDTTTGFPQANVGDVPAPPRARWTTRRTA